jgi:glyoxylase-like metal-dependent hydrolase (beta-lactamase superfamily II)
MNIEKIVVGTLEENCYLIIKDNNLLIVDPGDEFNKIKEKIDSLNKKVVGVLITHAHFDHIGALEEVLKEYNTNLYYNNVNNEISYEKLIDLEEKEYNIENFNFKTIFTSGHRNDLVTYYFYEENIMMTGDFLFRLSIGRTDLEYSNYDDMIKSINKIKKYDDEIIIYPGHGPYSTLGFEKENNMYLKEIL